MTTIPAEMTAIEIKEFGGPENLVPASRPVPEPGHDDVLIKVAAAGVNRPDVLQRRGGYAPPPGASDIPGLEISGEIVAIGQGVTRYQVGDKVCALVAGGGYAEYCVAPEAQCLDVPEGYDMVRAAAIPETYFTVWTNVFDRGRLKGGETFLVHGGASGIGTTAIQLAKAFGARVFTTASTDEKCREIEKLGAERAINYKTEDFVQVVKELTDGRGVDLILDMVGGDYIQRNISALAVEGRLVYIAFLGGPKADVNFAPVMAKRLTITGSTLRPQSVQAKSEIGRSLENKVWPLLSAGTVGPIIDSVFPLDKAADAHRRIDDSAHIGKIVLEVTS
ncbi:NAD(P)H-quinone oxidoreductase [Sneathiella chinensis]|uniref:NAD(P)H quinone oxidoreductase n=1 Tax=Sneathiella chinensis TaxID=349750 RepID=A0ABQ5U292_9PROT|nr:NAD(P)H-quinone oxidoreductase [Sneathiella chinensis]GLQ06270.1 NAD(P)H quinone oxidoreductase [Sneathiella chinensis]